MMKSSRLLVYILLPVLLITCPVSAGEDKSAKRPHIVLFLIDDLGWNDVGYHGSEIKTPHIDGLAAAGVRLNQFYVQPVCSPTRAALMTGRYPIRYGLQVGVVWPWVKYGLPLEERILPQALKEVGYRTVFIGKWHLGALEPAYHPRNRGFDHEYGHYLGAIDYFDRTRNGGLDWHRNGKALHEEGYTTNLKAREAVRIVEGHDPAKPLFMYVAFNAVHTPLQAPPEYVKKYKHIKKRKRRLFAAMTTCMDDAIGQIMGALKKRGMQKDTLVLFASDNGGAVGNGASSGLLRAGKGSLYEGGVRVPAFMVWPGKLKAGTIVNNPMHIVDWYPTLLKLVGASLDQPLPLDGVDAWPTITQGKPMPRKEILHNITPYRAGIRGGDWKLIVRKDKNKPLELKTASMVELFNIAEDPYEKQNVADRHPERVRELFGRLKHYEKGAAPAKNDPDKRSWPKDFKTPKVWGEKDS